MNYLVRESVQPSATKKIDTHYRRTKGVLRLVNQPTDKIKLSTELINETPVEELKTPSDECWRRRDFLKRLAMVKTNNYSIEEITKILER